MKYVFALVYVLVLATQLPHIWYAYSSLELADFALAHATAIGAALAFELSTGVFTLRVVQGSRRRWTRPGLLFFIVASVVANGYYYRWLPFVFDRLMPAFATIALPLSLALFAEEFGAEVKREQRASKRQAEREAAEIAPLTAADSYDCPVCGRSFTKQQALAGHMRAHNDGAATEPAVLERKEANHAVQM